MAQSPPFPVSNDSITIGGQSYSPLDPTKYTDISQISDTNISAMINYLVSIHDTKGLPPGITNKPSGMSYSQNAKIATVGAYILSVTGQDKTSVIATITEPVTQLPGAVTSVLTGGLKDLFSGQGGIARAGEILIGTVILAVGINAIIKDTTGHNPGRTATTLIPAARIARAGRSTFAAKKAVTGPAEKSIVPKLETHTQYREPGKRSPYMREHRVNGQLVRRVTYADLEG